MATREPTLTRLHHRNQSSWSWHLALVLAAAALLAGCASLTRSWQAPEVALAGLRPKSLTLDRQVFIATLKVGNPNDRTLPIKAMTYTLSLAGGQVAEGGGALAREIPAHGEALVEVEVAASLLDLLARLPALAQEDRPIDWTLSGTATIADGFLTLPYRYSGQISQSELLALARGAR